MPARMGDIVRELRRLGCTVEQPRHGSHWLITRPGIARPYPIPAHNGSKTMISDCYIDGVCRALGLDKREFRAAPR
jgi:hypothetical protein